jgi:hypothetical protein
MTALHAAAPDPFAQIFAPADEVAAGLARLGSSPPPWGASLATLRSAEPRPADLSASASASVRQAGVRRSGGVVASKQ